MIDCRTARPYFVALVALTLSAAIQAQPGSAYSASTDPSAIRVLLSADPESTLSALMSGRIQTLSATLGQTVSKGKQLVQLDCAEPRARQQMADAELAGARATLNAKRELRQLNAAGDTEVMLAQAAADRATAALALARAQVSYCSVSAPFSGRIAKVHVRPDESVAAGAPLVELVGDGPLKLRMNIPSKLLKDVKLGSKFQLTVNETDAHYPARVSAISARVDAVAQSIEIEGRLLNPAPELLPGMSGIAQFQPAR